MGVDMDCLTTVSSAMADLLATFIDAPQASFDALPWEAFVHLSPTI